MSLLVKLALRNLKRHTRRAVITGVSIALGLALLMVSVTLQEGAYRDMVETGVELYAGHVVVQGKGYQEEREPRITVRDTEEVRRVAARVLPGAQLTGRVFLDGLLTAPRGATGTFVIGIRPEEEAPLTSLDERLVQGRWLEPDEDDGVILGATLAESLELELGDRVVLMYQRSHDIESRLFRLRGVFRTGSDELDGFLALVPLTAAQSVVGLADDVTQLALYLPDIQDAEEAAARLGQALGPREVEVLPWMQALPRLYEYIVIDEAGGYVFLGVIALIVVIGVLNTMLMSVLERTRELGLLLCLGMSPARMLALVLLEAGLLGSVAASLGFALGGALSAWLIVNGLDYSALFGEAIELAGVVVDPKIHGAFVWRHWLLFAALTVASAGAAGLYPALRAARLEPLAALHQP